jgi:GAF domain-containing protein
LGKEKRAMSETISGREGLLSKAFVGLADALIDDYDIIDLLDQLVGHCSALFAVDAAGILLADAQGFLQIVASSDEDVSQMELLQLQADDGPCVECVRTSSAVAVPDLAEVDDRWPALTEAMRTRRLYRAVYAVPLRLRGTAIGAMNLFRWEPGSLPEDDLALAQALADVATVAILQERAVRRGEVLIEQLQTALNSRVIIEQAKGVLAQHGGLTMSAAFERLRSHSRSRNQRISEVARRIVEGDLELSALDAPRTG